MLEPIKIIKCYQGLGAYTGYFSEYGPGLFCVVIFNICIWIAFKTVHWDESFQIAVFLIKNISIIYNFSDCDIHHARGQELTILTWNGNEVIMSLLQADVYFIFKILDF